MIRILTFANPTNGVMSATKKLKHTKSLSKKKKRKIIILIKNIPPRGQRKHDFSRIHHNCVLYQCVNRHTTWQLYIKIHILEASALFLKKANKSAYLQLSGCNQIVCISMVIFSMWGGWFMRGRQTKVGDEIFIFYLIHSSYPSLGARDFPSHLE